MIKTTVKITGSVRPWEGPVENWQAHKEVIEHWCEGREVDSGLHGEFSRVMAASPVFDAGLSYRKAQRKPRAGEVWFAPAYNEHGLYTEVIGMVSLQSGLQLSCTNDIQYAAPSLAAYYAREFLGDTVPDSTVMAISAIDHVLGRLFEAAQLEQGDMTNSIYIGDNQSDNYVEFEFQEDGSAELLSHAGWDCVANTASVEDLRQLNAALTSHLRQYDATHEDNGHFVDALYDEVAG